LSYMARQVFFLAYPPLKNGGMVMRHTDISGCPDGYSVYGIPSHAKELCARISVLTSFGSLAAQLAIKQTVSNIASTTTKI